MEIRRSVMARPNLSVRSTVLKFVAEGKRTGRIILAADSFPMHSSRNAGGASVSTCTLGSSAAVPGALGGTILALTKDETPSRSRQDAGATTSPPQPGYALRPQRSETHCIIELAENEKVSRFSSDQSLFNRRLGQRRHDLVSRSVRVQPIVGQIFFHVAPVVDHGTEVVEIEAGGVRRNTVILQPAVQVENFRRRALRKKFL